MAARAGASKMEGGGEGGLALVSWVEWVCVCFCYC